jgi:hypothetical protein
MNWTGAFIVAGYVALVALWGWPGLLAAAAHIGVLLLTVRRK